MLVRNHKEDDKMRVDYTIAQKVLHWLMAILIMLDLVVAQKFGDFLEVADRLESRSDHGSLGTIVAILFLTRLYLRFRYGAPPLPEAMPQWQVTVAKVAHWALYLLIGCLIVTGVVTAVNAADPILLFGQLDITIGQMNEETFDFLRQFHELTTEALIVLIGLHIVAALYHLIVIKDQVTQRMLKFWRSEAS